MELLVSEMGQHPASAGVQQQLLVHRADLEAVRSVVAGIHPSASPGVEVVNAADGSEAVTRRQQVVCYASTTMVPVIPTPSWGTQTY